MSYHFEYYFKKSIWDKSYECNKQKFFCFLFFTILASVFLIAIYIILIF